MDPRLIGIVRDITAQKQAEEQLAFQAALLDQIEDAVIAVDNEERVLYLNAAAAEQYGVALQEALGQKLSEVYQYLWLSPQEEARAHAALAEKGQWRGENRHITRRGETLHVKSKVSVLQDAMREPVGMVAVIRDITAQKQIEAALQHEQERGQKLFDRLPVMLTMSEQRFRTALQNTPTIIAHMDTQLRYTWIHNPHPDFPVDEVIGKRDDELAENEATRTLIKLKQDVLSSGVGMRQEITFPLSDGPHMYDIVCEPLYDPDGVIVGLTTMALDITERKRAETERERLLATAAHEQTHLAERNETLEQRVQERTEQVRRLAGQLSVAEREERERIAHVLHDHVQQMLYAIHLQVRLLELELSAQSAKSVQERLTVLKRLAEDAAEATRSLAHELNPPILQTDDLGELVQWLADHMQELHGLRTTVRGKGGSQSIEKNSRLLLFHTLRELLFNVVKHAGVAEAAITVTKRDGFVRISVRDEGVGFEPSRLTTSLPAEPGHGLFSLRERLQLHRGDMQIQSAPGQGTEVTIVLPQ